MLKFVYIKKKTIEKWKMINCKCIRSTLVVVVVVGDPGFVYLLFMLLSLLLIIIMDI